MKLKDILQNSAIIGTLEATDKKSALDELALFASKVYPQLSKETIFEVLMEREKLGSTGVGNGVAIPHGKVSNLNSIVCLFGRSLKGIEFYAHDQKPAHLFFVLLAPENVVGNHLQALARISRLLKTEEFRKRLLEVNNEDLYETLINEDEKM